MSPFTRRIAPASSNVPAAQTTAPMPLELLENRVLFSWAGVPPSAIAVPSSPVSVSLNTAGDASGSASIVANEADFYRFTVRTTGTHRLAATTPFSSVDTVLGVYNSTGQRLAYNDDISTGVNTDSNLTVSLTAGRVYYFGVSNYTGTPGGSYSWLVDGPSSSTTTDDAYENNDTLSTATNLGTLTSARTLSGLRLADDADWFRFTQSGTGGSGDFVRINFTHSLGDIELALYNSAGSLLAYSDSASNSEQISLQGRAAGTYFVRVYGYQGARNTGTYSLTVDPAAGTTTPPPPTGGRGVLYFNFEGAALSNTQLRSWAGTDWAGSLSYLDPEGDGVRVTQFLAGRGDREQVISGILSNVQTDLRPFGITVQRWTGTAVTGQGATTVFFGRHNMANIPHVASDVDFSNNNRTDIAFVQDENWGSTANTITALSDVALHEAGHTYGLFHVNAASGGFIQPESMGLRYTAPQSGWLVNTRFMDQTFSEYQNHGGGRGSQNAYRTMLQNFGLAGGSPVVGATGSFVAAEPVLPPAALREILLACGDDGLVADHEHDEHDHEHSGEHGSHAQPPPVAPPPGPRAFAASDRAVRPALDADALQHTWSGLEVWQSRRLIVDGPVA